MTFRRRDLLKLAGALAATPAFGQAAYPSRPVRMIVPFAPGGPADIVGRIVAQYLGDIFGQTFFIDNRAGGGGVVGAETVARAVPDGYTLLFSSNTAFTVTPAIRKDLPYDPKRDIAVVSTVAQGPQVLVVRASLGVDSVPGLIARAKREPGKLTFASSGAGTIIQFAGELFKYRAGIAIVHVPYRGGGPAVAGLLGGEVDMMINDLSPVLAYINTGQLKALAVASDHRVAAIPDTPTFAEAGLPDVITSSWFCIGAPGATPAAVIETLSAAVGRVLETPAYRSRLADLGLEPFGLTPQQATAFIQNELGKWTDLAVKANIQIE